ncbi:MAG TPA: OmpA family protein [Bacteroidia bacterium]|nr:OmpA family protein [Bacteroidia bacterium]
MRKKTNFFYFLCISFLFLTTTTFAQKNALKDADNGFKNLRYFDAIELYKKAYTDLGDKSGKGDKATKARILFQVAECYRMLGDAKQEVQWYGKAIKANYPDDNDLLYKADAERQLGNYDDALTDYKAFKDKVPSNKAADAGIESCQKASEWKNNPTRYVVTDMVQINTKNRDYSPAYADRRFDEIYFVSTRPGGTGDKIDGNIGESFADIYDTKMDKNGKWSAPVPLPAPINTADNEGPMCFDHGFKTLYFTRCGVTKNKGVHCQIWYAERKGNTWGDPVMIPFQNDSTTYGYPTLSADDQELFFSSDMAGGYGKEDIYVSHYDKKAKTWGTPVNLGPDINTAGNEVFPFMHTDGTLYFSSDGWPGMGGLDIFKAAKLGPDKWGKVENMKYPINSEADDFGIVYEGTKERGYFASNRALGKGSDDIYSFNLPPLLFAITGTVRDDKTLKPIKGATVHMVGSDGSDNYIKTDTGGHYFYAAKSATERYVKQGASYILSADASDLEYLASKVKATVSTVGQNDSKTWIEDFTLTKADLTVRLKFPRVEYALDKAILTENSKDSLNYLVKLLKDNPTIKIELDAHTDPQGSEKHNMPLSQARAQSCVDYLISQGIDSARLKAKGWGFTQTLPGCSAADIAKMKTNEEKQAAYQADRRTEFRVLSFSYVPKGGLSHADSVRMERLKHAEVSGQGAEHKDSTDVNPPQQGPTPGNKPSPAPGGPMKPNGYEGMFYKKN